MHIRDIFAEIRTTFSFEFFPPKSEAGAAELFTNIAELESLRPTFVSATYGAGGSTRELTHELVVKLKTTTTLDPIPHLTCVCHDQAEIDQILLRYAKAGISNIMTLRGDVPKGQAGEPWKDFRYAAQLVRHIRKFNDRSLHH